MEEEKAPDLTKTTASEWLRLLSETAKVNYNKDLGKVTGMDGRASFVPENRLLPKVDFTGSVGENQPAVGGLTVGSDLLSYARKYEDLPKNQGGPRTTDTVEGGVGRLRGFYQKSGQTGNPGSRTTAYGGRLNMGPVSLYADRTRSNRTSQNAGFNFNFGPLTGGLSRRSTTGQPDATSADLGYEGRVGPGILGLRGNLTDVRNVGTGKSIGGSYNVDDPFGLGGNLSATGSYNNPLGGKSAAEAWLKYKLKFGGGR